jgi:glycerol-3-phosphate acyltransferase PlsY
MTVAAIVLAYLAGCFPTGLLLTRRIGIDVRHVGSGNIGATNVTRAAGRRLGALTLLGDALKGALPPVLAGWLGAPSGVVVATGVAAVTGHTYPITLGFRGGKGVATAFGMLLALAPVVALASAGTFAATVYASRRVSVGSLVAALSAPLFMVVAGSNGSAVVGMVAASVLVLVRHRDNLGRLLDGTEPRL